MKKYTPAAGDKAARYYGGGLWMDHKSRPPLPPPMWTGTRTEHAALTLAEALADYYSWVESGKPE